MIQTEYMPITEVVEHVGLMFFSLEPHKYFPYAQIDIVQFPDDLGGDRIIEKTFKGPLRQ